MRQTMLSDDDFNVDTDFTRPAQNFDYATCRSKAALRVAGYLYVHHGAIQLRQPQPPIARRRAARMRRAHLLTQLRSQFVSWRDGYLVLDSRVIRQNYVSMRAVPEKPDDRRILALKNLYHAAFCAPVGFSSFDARQHAVAIHRVSHAIAPDEKVAFHARNRRVRHQEAVPIAVRDHSS